MAVEIAEGLNKDVGCVIASLTYELSYMKLMKAVSYLDNPDVIFIGTNTDPVFPVQKGCVLPGRFLFRYSLVETIQYKVIIDSDNLISCFYFND